MDSIRRHQTVVMVVEELGVMGVAETVETVETEMAMVMELEHSMVLMVAAEVEVEFQYLH